MKLIICWIVFHTAFSAGRHFLIETGNQTELSSKEKFGAKLNPLMDEEEDDKDLEEGNDYNHYWYGGGSNWAKNKVPKCGGVYSYF